MLFSLQLDRAGEIKEAGDKLASEVSSMQATLQRIAAPNMKAMEK